MIKREFHILPIYAIRRTCALMMSLMFVAHAYGACAMQGRHTMGVVSEYTLLFICSAALLWGIRRVMKNRIDSLRSKRADKLTILQEALEVTGDNVVVYNTTNGTVICRNGNLFEGTMAVERFYKMFHPEDQEALLDRRRLLDSGRTVEEGRTYRFKKPGEKQWREYKLTSVKRNADNGVSKIIVSIYSDVTEKKVLDRRSEETKNIQSQIFNIPLVGISIYSPDGYLVQTNEKMREIFNFHGENDEFYSKVCLFDLAPMVGNMTANTVRDVSICHKVYVPERGVSKDMELRCCPIRDTEGEVLYILIMARPFNEERELHRESVENGRRLSAQKEELQTYEQDVQILFEHVGMRVCQSSIKDRMIRIYNGLSTVEKEVSFDRIYNLLETEEEREMMKGVIEPSQDTPITYKEVVYKLPLDLMRGEPAETWYAGTYIPNENENGEIDGAYGLIRNITTTMRYRKQLKLDTQRVQETGKRKTEFLANMTHEIRTPLNSVIGFCELLVATEDRASCKEYIGIINRNCRQLSKLIGDLLEISALDSGSEETIKIREIEFETFFRETCAALERNFTKPKVSLYVEDSPFNVLRVKIDNNAVVQVINNFADNALKFTTEGHVRIGWRLDGEAIYVYCEDTGKGIPKEKQTVIFERFMKLDDFTPGTGVGLSICKGLVERLGGALGVMSEGDGKGSTFWATIPCEVIEKK